MLTDAASPILFTLLVGIEGVLDELSRILVRPTLKTVAPTSNIVLTACSKLSFLDEITLRIMKMSHSKSYLSTVSPPPNKDKIVVTILIPFASVLRPAVISLNVSLRYDSKEFFSKNPVIVLVS